MGITFKSTLKRLFPFYETSFRELFDGSKFSFFPYYFLGGHIVLIRQMIFSSYNMVLYGASIVDVKFERSLCKTEKNCKMRQKYYIAFLKCALEMVLKNY